MSKNIIVIGGGVVGLTSAWALLEAGHHVTLLERHDQVGGGASFGNGGQLSYRYVSPLADAGIPLKALAWLTQPDGPLRFRPQADPHQWRWLMAFLRNCNAADNHRTTASLLQLGELSRAGMQRLAQLMPSAEYSWRAAGKLVLYRSPSIFASAVRQAEAMDRPPAPSTPPASAAVKTVEQKNAARRLRKEDLIPITGGDFFAPVRAPSSASGPDAAAASASLTHARDGEPGKGDNGGKSVEAAPARRVLTPAGALFHEPALAALEPLLAGAIYTEGEAVADCHAFCQTLEGLLQLHPRFQCIVKGEARALVTSRGKVSGVLTDRGVLEANYFVLAAGIQSRALAASAGIALPLYPLKGYSLTAPIRAGHQPPAISVTDFERKVLYARIGDNLRVTAMVDLVGEDAGLDPRRVASLTRLAKAGMPRGADYDRGVAWAGLRPATPDSAPIVSATPYPNLWLNTGHGPLGFTFACGTAAVLAGLVDQRPAPFPLDFLRLRR